MTRARREQISLSDTPYYHVINRCVRRAFLCGEDRYTGKNFDHRRQWMLDKMKQLAGVFCLDVCAYAIMSNHFHLVLFVNEQQVQALTRDKVIARWMKLFLPPAVVSRYLSGDTLLKDELMLVDKYVETWRERLMDISWFMRCLNEHMAREANKEDNCKGRFWEGRFKSQALLDEKALLTCMAYVDLNPIRAGLASSPETSSFTSIQQRLATYVNAKKPQKNSNKQPSDLKHFSVKTLKDPARITFKLQEYFQLVDATGRIIRNDKRGAIPANLLPILQRLNIEPDKWLTHMQGHNSHKSIAFGPLHKLRRYASQCGFKWVRGSLYNLGLFGV